MPDKLPKGWVKTTLGEILEPSRERASPMDHPAMRYVGLEHIEPRSMKLLKYGYAREARSSAVRFSKGDILYAKMRPYLNKVWVAEFWTLLRRISGFQETGWTEQSVPWRTPEC